MRRLLSLLLALSLALALSWPVLAADLDHFTDIEGHWALDYIAQAVNGGLMNGTSETAFSPDDGMTRGMFVTVLGRFAEINPDAWKMNYDGVLFQDVPTDSYYAPYVNWAARVGITLGSGHGSFHPNDPITREQMLAMLQRYANATGKIFQPISEDVQTMQFTDAAEISGWALAAVEQLRSCGIIQGVPSPDGTLRFSPKSKATRAQAAAIFCRVQASVSENPNWSETFVSLVMLDETTATLASGESITLTAQVFPTDATNKTISWVSSNPKVATVDGGKVEWVSAGSCTIYAYSSNGCKVGCDIICKKAAAATSAAVAGEFFPQDLNLAYADESYARKCD